jgi:serine protease
LELYDDQTGPPSWGLDRIDQPTLPFDGNYHYEYSGEGVIAFVVDGGIRLTHEDFGGRASCGFDAYPEDGGSCSDLVGHGTHVAGTLGGARYGVAKGVELVSVKVLPSAGGGSLAAFIAGVDYVKAAKDANPKQPMVANMSVGGARRKSANDAVKAAADAGVVMVAAAGNSARSACSISPGSSDKVITVGATKKKDKFAVFSNFGPCVDILAPGQGIISAFVRSDTDSIKKTGTSMAAPHVAGVAAMYLEKHPNMSPQEVFEVIEKDAVHDVITDITNGATPNVLVNTGALTLYPQD